jgi:N-acetyl-gamma-glutamyl-phosphate reductase
MSGIIRVGVIGGMAYTARELLRWLLVHPRVKITVVTSDSSAGKPLVGAHRVFSGQIRKDFLFSSFNPAVLAKSCDVVFLCLPHAESAKRAAVLLNAGLKVIDLSADFRLNSPAVYEKWYANKHPCPELLKEAVYGLPELFRKDIPKARLIANPGCYATTAILSAAPLLSNGWADGQGIIVDAKSGVSGAGRKLDARYLFGQTHENFLAYGVAQHRHMPEIDQILTRVLGKKQAGKKVEITFVPHLLPVHRGILATSYLPLKRAYDAGQIQARYATFYANEPFVEVLPLGQFPELAEVQGTNFVRMGIKVTKNGRLAIVVAVLDNLAKGASSQAVQNMNLLFGLEETLALGGQAN